MPKPGVRFGRHELSYSVLATLQHYNTPLVTPDGNTCIHVTALSPSRPSSNLDDPESSTRCVYTDFSASNSAARCHRHLLWRERH
ncbi:uncharacterized protein K441DRAFT_652497 [Cenococcum geophilum 1.58]|uniref:uncharacterized protein n=1 Tax=Cenococcum geophilum 1.58 TaxID=794803 RepID=UPI00358E204D|nr:hypothetical protein K441DRAFT_652497 [Cenococcum geophilum 1.58]